MSLVYVIIINIIIIFIAFVVLNNKINKKSTSTLLEKYAGEVENLIIELNRAVEDVLNLSEERIEELKKLIKKAERILNKPAVKKSLSSTRRKPEASVDRDSKNDPVIKEPEIAGSAHLLEKTKHLLSMGHSKEEIAKILRINRAEVDFLESLNKG